MQGELAATDDAPARSAHNVSAHIPVDDEATVENYR